MNHLLLPLLLPFLVQGIPKLTTEVVEVLNVSESTEIELSCRSSETVSIAWYYNDDPDLSMINASISGDNISSILRAYLSVNQSGVFICRAANREGYDSLAFVVLVGRPPRITVGAKTTIRTTLNQVIPFGCLYGNPTQPSMPADTVTWYKERSGKDDVITQTTADSNIYVAPDDFQLVITTTEMTDDRFYCVAQNSFGTSTSDQVAVSLLNNPPSDTPTSRMENLYLVDTQTGSLTCCEQFGRKMFNIKWLRNGQLLGSLENMRIIEVGGVRGVYCCELRDSGTLVTTYCAYVLPRESPSFVVQPRTVVTAMAGQKVALVATANGVNAPVIDWFINGSNVPLEPNSKFSILKNERWSYLIINNVSANDSGIYVYSASNFITATTSFVNVQIVDPFVGPNLVSDPGAEYDDNSWSLQGSAIKSVFGENVFQLPLISNPPLITQNIVIPANVQRLRISARKRQSASANGTSPFIDLMIGGSSYRLNWDKHFSSDWLSSFADITLDAPSDSRLSALLSATYEITSGPIGSGSVYFDDISVVTLEAVPSNDSDLTSDEIDYLPIIIGVSTGGAVLVLLGLLIVCCWCCCRYYRRENIPVMRKESTLKRRLHNFRARFSLKERHGNASVMDKSTAQKEENNLYDTIEDPEYADVKPPVAMEHRVLIEDIDEPAYYIEGPSSVPKQTDSKSNLLGPPSAKQSQTSLNSRMSSFEASSDGQYLELLPSDSKPHKVTRTTGQHPQSDAMVTNPDAVAKEHSNSEEGYITAEDMLKQISSAPPQVNEDDYM